MDHCTVKYLLLLSAYIHLTSADSFSLQYLYTAVTPGIHFPEFPIVGLVDGEQFVYYDSNTREMIPKTEWIKEIVGEEYWNREKRRLLGTQKTFKATVYSLMKSFKQTTGVHTVQWRYGCELHEDGSEGGYSQFGYDGEDWLSLDLNTETWTAANANANITKQEWESSKIAYIRKAYLENECISWLKKYVEHVRAKVPPEVSLFQKDSSSPVVCHATGFYPKAVMISWKKNGEDLYEDVDYGKTLPNQDGTFQKRSNLTVPLEKLERNQYTCVVQHGGLEREMVLLVSDRRVLSGGESGLITVGVVIGVVVTVLLLGIIGCVGVVIWKKKQMEQSGFKPVPSCSSSDSGSVGSSTTPSTTKSD